MHGINRFDARLLLWNRGGCGSQTPDPGGRPSPVDTVSPCARVMDRKLCSADPRSQIRWNRARPGESSAACFETGKWKSRRKKKRGSRKPLFLISM